MPSPYLFYSSGPPCTIKIRQIMHGLPMAALHCLTVKLDDTAPGPQSIGLGQGGCFAVPSIGLRIQRRQMVFSLTQTNDLLLAITGTPARQSTTQSPIAISRITAPISSRADLRRSPGSGEEAEDGPLSSWENANQDQRKVGRKYHHIVCVASHRGVPHSVNIGTSLIKNSGHEEGSIIISLACSKKVIACRLWVMCHQTIVHRQFVIGRSIALACSTVRIFQPQLILTSNIYIAFLTQLMLVDYPSLQPYREK